MDVTLHPKTNYSLLSKKTIPYAVSSVDSDRISSVTNFFFYQNMYSVPMA